MRFAKTAWGLIGLSILMGATSGAHARIEPIYEAQTVPEKQNEADLWESASKHENRIRNSGTPMRAPEVEAYLEDLARRLVGNRLDNAGIQIDFMVIREAHLSGWVYPYGTIGLHTGLMVRMDNEAQLAAIVAHEISHFLQRHTYREMVDAKRQGAIGKGLGFLASVAVASETGTFDKGIMDAAGDFWKNLSTSGYSKKNEYVADEEGLLLMHEAGFDIAEAIPAFEALAENEVYGFGDPRKMWSSHPRLEDRLSNLEKEIRKMKRKKGFKPGIVPSARDYHDKIAPVLLRNAKLDMRATQFVRAREALQHYVSVRPEDPEGHFLMGEALRVAAPLGPDFSEALAAYEAALAQDSGYALAHREIGMAHRIQGNAGAARSAFANYLQNAPDAPDAGIVRAYMEGL